MRWLHLTDLHWGRDNEQQIVASSALLESISGVCDSPVDIIFITGDISYSGKEEEYESFSKKFLAPLREIPTIGDAPIVAVPGNHDVNCELGSPNAWDTIGQQRQENYFNFDEVGRKLRLNRVPNFSAYLEFADKNGIFTPDFSEKPADIINVLKDREIDVIAVNTCFFSDYQMKDEHKTPAPTYPVYYLSKGIAKGRQIIVLGHYPITWFINRTQKPFRTKLLEKNAIYLHGHEHEIEASFEATGLVSLGFGASYIGSSTATPKHYYRNSFTICELDSYLHVAPYVWDSENGRWIPEAQVPPSFTEQSTILKNGYQLPIARSSAIHAGEVEKQRSYAAVNADLTLGDPVWLTENDADTWQKVMEALELFQGISQVSGLPKDLRSRNHSQFVVTDKAGKHLISAISAVGDIVSKKLVEETNTSIDTQSLDSAIILTLGSVSEDARTLADQLASNRKAITILDRVEISNSLSSKYLRRRLESIVDSHEEPISIRPLFFTDGIYLIVSDRLSIEWFMIVDLAGGIASGSSEIAFKLRENQSPFKTTRYLEDHISIDIDSSGDVKLEKEIFDPVEYKKKCKEIHDDIEYSGLASIGLQMPNKPLKQLYVPTSADSVVSDAEQENMSLAISDAVNALDLSSDERTELHQALIGQYGVQGSAEYGAASEMYERYGNVLVEGDPGSGKSLFVRNAIINYCETYKGGVSWYSQHIPVFLPLAEVSGLIRKGDSLLEACVDYARTTRLEIYIDDLEGLIASGKVAFFFDGLDEISTIDERSEMMNDISRLIERFSPLGNRFVITSRPAAVQSVDVPSQLARMSLRGLTDAEVRLLAEKILATSILEDGTRELSESQKEVVDRLVKDCTEVPGIRRLGRNPLLLTLLVLIYANSGPMVAKRHIIYGQAIKTLVSVRVRQVQREALSEADLRREMGIIAFAVYSGVVQEIPTRREIYVLLKGDPKSSFYSRDSEIEIAEFLEAISVSTGLIRFHERSEEKNDDVLTFMHHSFLEYYAAIKLIDQGFIQYLSEICFENRWREIIVLAAGIYADRFEATDIIRELRLIRKDIDFVTGKNLILALECASEADVPPTAAQAVLGEWVVEYIEKGAARISSTAKEEIAKPLQSLVESTHSAIVAEALSQAILHPSSRVSAAAIEISSYLGELVNNFSNIQGSFASASSREDSIIRSAIIRSIGRSQAFRNESTLKMLSNALERGATEERNAALIALESNPQLGISFAKELKRAVFEESPFSYRASRVSVRSKAYRDHNSIDIEFLDKALQRIIEVQGGSASAKLSLVLDHNELDGWIHSDVKQEKIRGLRLLGLSEQNVVRAYELLLGAIKVEKDSAIIAEALNSIAHSSSIAPLLRLDDVALIVKKAHSKFGNVRKAAIKLLGKVPSLHSVIEELLTIAKDLEGSGNYSEYEECISSLANHAESSRMSEYFLLSEFEEELNQGSRGWGEFRKRKLGSLALAIDVGSVEISEQFISNLHKFLWDYTVPDKVRNAFILLFSKIAHPSSRNSQILVEIVRRKISAESELACRATMNFVRRCRGHIEYVRNSYDSLGEVQQILLKYWRVESGKETAATKENSLELMRNSIIEINRIQQSYSHVGLDQPSA